VALHAYALYRPPNTIAVRERCWQLAADFAQFSHSIFLLRKGGIEIGTVASFGLLDGGILPFDLCELNDLLQQQAVIVSKKGFNIIMWMNRAANAETGNGSPQSHQKTAPLYVTQARGQCHGELSSDHLFDFGDAFREMPRRGNKIGEIVCVCHHPHILANAASPAAKRRKAPAAQQSLNEGRVIPASRQRHNNPCHNPPH